MDLTSEEKNNKYYLKVNLQPRKKTESIKVFTTLDAFKYIRDEYDLKENISLVSKPAHDLMNHTINLSGEWIFEIKNKTSIDNIKKDVIIKETKIEAKSTIKQDKEASPPTKKLPYGLKKTETKPKPKKKRAPRKKKTEE